AGLALRSIGPASASGRVGDLAVHPHDRNTYYVAVASGGVWKTTNAGTTWTPIFDGEGSYSIGCVTIDPSDPHVVWVGTGENNSQRSVGYGDGVYKSLDGGAHWTRMGLERSEHIGKIVVDPRDSDTVYAAAQGPLWAPGGERGLYKTTDGGSSWKLVLEISENTGVTDVVLDPRDPDVLLAASYQRRRRVWGQINGGPESAIHKSTDGGSSWRKLEHGLPQEGVGRVGLAISPANPDVVYAIVEAGGDGGGFYRSVDRGETWEKRSDYVSHGQYYQEIIPDPHNVDRVYSNDTWMQVTEDGGKSFHDVGETYKHVDNHALWIDPDDTDFLLVGCDGGVYESFDRGATWRFMANLPVTQFYKIAVDNDFPFYNVYGGTQDNATLGGPARTTSATGIVNSDWFVPVMGDGFQARVDPEDPNIVYAQPQYGELVRFDRKSGEMVDIKPQAGAGEEPLRWNWDSPLMISPHLHTRLYFAANRLFRSDDRGNTWQAVSPDLTRQIDRNQLPMMGKVWSIDAVSKNRSTSFYGNIVSLAESPRVEGLLWVGTDDGLVQVSEDGGGTWRRIESFPGVPERTYVNSLAASQHAADTVYAAFNNHKSGDFKPYLLRSDDRGRSWRSIAGDLPERGSVYVVVEDHELQDLLFAGTEFGVFFTIDGGGEWIELTGGMPTIAVRDLAIQRRENDLVVGTFGRGFYILDDYTPLRHVDAERLAEEALLFPVKKAWMYIESTPFGLRGKAFQGASFYSAPNPPVGAVVTYYLEDSLQTRREKRRAAEKEAEEKGETFSYPSWEELRAEEREEEPAILLTVTDEEGYVIRRLTAPATAGLHRVTWDLRFASPDPTRLEPWSGGPFAEPPIGPMVVPGSYQVSLAKRVDGEETPLGEPQTFSTVPLGVATLPAEDWPALFEFQRQTARLQRAVLGAVGVAGETGERLALIKKAIDDTPGADAGFGRRARELESRLADLRIRLTGDEVVRGHNEPAPPSIVGRLDRIVSGHWTATSAATRTFHDAYDVAAGEFAEVLAELRVLVEDDLARLEDELEVAGAPWTPGRVPRWERE
ncbi:MAG: glycosyl hydrolase, partial [bacterium]|nr:glycosyl hydrolase [bacterium]